jgi:glycerol kinase
MNMLTWDRFIAKVVNKEDDVADLYKDGVELSPAEKLTFERMFPSESSASIVTDPIQLGIANRNRISEIYSVFKFENINQKLKAHDLHKVLVRKFNELNSETKSQHNKKYVLSLDLGTTNIRAFLVHISGKIEKTSTRELTPIRSSCGSGEAEHDANEIWSCTQDVIREILKIINVNEIDSIGLTVQRETCLLWDKTTGNPFYNAISWEDKRTGSKCLEIEKLYGNLIYQRTGLPVDPYFSATKLQFLIDKVTQEGNWNDNILAGTIDTWILWNLTQRRVHATDHSNASRTMLMNIETLEWDDDLLKLFEIPQNILPEIFSSMGYFGDVDASLFGSNIPIYAVLGDQQSALYGHKCNSENSAKCTYGTGGFLVKFMGNKVPKSARKLISTIAWTEKNIVNYALEGSMFTSGSAVKWLRNNLEIIDDVKKSSDEAEKVDDNGGVYFVPALSGLGVPHWDASARGAFMGMTGGTKKEHLIRSVLEAIAYQVKEVFDIMNDASDAKIEKLKVDGGASDNDFLMQFQADLLGIPIERPGNQDVTVYGAALAAGLASGFWSSLENDPARFCNPTETIRIFNPSSENHAYAQNSFRVWQDAVKRTKNWNIQE